MNAGYFVLGWTPGPWELGIILVIVLVVFGPGKLPLVGKSFGAFIANFKREMRGISDDTDRDDDTNEKKDRDREKE